MTYWLISDFFSGDAAHTMTQCVDDESKSFVMIAVGSCFTHDKSKCYECSNIKVPTQSEKNSLVAPLINFIYEKEQREREIEYPECYIGQRVELKKDIKNRPKIKEPCDKCSGAGKWTNPYKVHDIRKCFKCKGNGVMYNTTSGSLVPFKAGACGEIVDYYITTGHKSKITRCVIKMDDGRIAVADKDNCRLNTKFNLFM